jgi:Flp pilus assembly protein TadG
MKIDRRKTGLRMLMAAAAATSLAACATETDRDEAAGTEQNARAASELTPDKSMMTENMPAAEAARLAGTAASADKPLITPRTPCRRVTASSIPVFTSSSSGTVRCTFFAGDVFSYFAAASPPLRFQTWCPRGVPPAQGTVSWAQGAGTVDGGCAP